MYTTKPYPRNHDHAWKQAIEHMPKQFVAFFLPELYDDIDFRKPPIFLEKELLNLIPNQKKRGYHIADKLLEFKRKDGKQQGVLIHIEIQATRDRDFDERLYISQYRAYDYLRRLPRNKKKRLVIESMAIFVTEEASKSPLQFELVGKYSYVLYRFGTYHIKDCSLEALLKSPNPFALAVAACLESNATSPQNRLAPKRKLINLLSERKYSRLEINALFWFIHLIMVLPEEQETQLFSEYTQQKKEDRMEFIIKMVDYEAKSMLDLIFTADGKKSVTQLLADYKEMEERFKKEMEEKERRKAELERLAEEEKARMQKQLAMAAEKLKQQVIRLHKLGMGVSEIAEILGEKRGRVGSIIDEYEDSLA